MAKLSITKTFRFSASHSLPNHNGLCQRLHGHSYLLEVTVSGNPKKDSKSPEFGMIMDFGKLKKVVTEHVINKFDHNHLNNPFANPTAENMTIWIAETLRSALRLQGIELSKIRLWEEMGSACCTWETHRVFFLEQ